MSTVLKNTSTKHSKYVVNQELDHVDENFLVRYGDFDGQLELLNGSSSALTLSKSSYITTDLSRLKTHTLDVPWVQAHKFIISFT